jgi:glycosyltransferase involved in cell wall biosynthesis
LKILYISPEYPIPKPSGGIASYVQDIARELAKMGHEIKILCIDEQFSNQASVHIINDEGIDVHFISKTIIRSVAKIFENPWLRRSLQWPLPDIVPLIAPLAAFIYWRQLKRSWIPDIIETFDWKGTGLFVAFFKEDIPVILRGGGHCKAIIPANDRPWTPFFESQHRIERWCARCSSHVVPCSNLLGQDEKSDFQISWEKITAVPMCVTPSLVAKKYTNALTADEIRIAFVGRLEFRKGVDLLIQAGQRLFPRYPHIEYYLIGRQDVDLSIYMEDEPSGLAFRQKLHVMGQIPRDQVQKWLIECNFAVFPSRYEPFGIVALEAMACGIPVIVSDAGGWREAVEDEVSGLIVKANDVESLRQAIERMILFGHEKRSEMGLRGREIVENKYLPTAIADQMLNIYDHLLKSPSKRED